MSLLKAFIGHSFIPTDEIVVRAFLKYFDQIKDMNSDFSWEHAEAAEPKDLAEKILRLTEGKNLFIGICTKREAVVEEAKLTSGIWNKKILQASVDSFELKTSDWIIQEIGLAIGKEMDLILLVENGLRLPGGLQGNIEYISFDRSSPEKSFGKVLEMIRSLTPKTKSVTTGEAEVRTAPGEKPGSEPKQAFEWLIPKPDWNRGDFVFALFHAIFDGDKENEEKIAQAYLATEEGKTSQKKESWMAYHELTLLRCDMGGQLTKLDEFAKKNPDNPEILDYRAQGYQKYGQHEKAAYDFEAAAQKTPELLEKLGRYQNAAVAFTQSGRTIEATRVIDQMKSIAEGETGELQLLYTLKEIAKIDEADDNFYALTERILDHRPGDTNLRFELAYKYSQKGDTEDLSLYHYLKIPQNERNPTTWNNLGVQFEHFDLSSKAVKAYRKSEESGETLAMSNLAHKFIKAGFLKEAEDICNRAIKEENFHKNVGPAIARIRDVPDLEQEKEREIIKKATPISEFYRDYGHALSKNMAEGYAGRWKGPVCELTITMKDSSFIAEGNYERSETGFGFGAAFLLAQQPGLSTTVTKHLVRYEGSIVGRTVKAFCTRSKEGEPASSILSPKDNATPVLMILSDLSDEIRVYEKDSKKDNKFYTLTRIG